MSNKYGGTQKFTTTDQKSEEVKQVNSWYLSEDDNGRQSKNSVIEQIENYSKKEKAHTLEFCTFPSYIKYKNKQLWKR